MCLGEKLERKERGFAQKTAQNLFFFFWQNEGFGCIYSLIMTLWLPTIQGLPATPVDINNSAFFGPSLNACFKIFSDLD